MSRKDENIFLKPNDDIDRLLSDHRDYNISIYTFIYT